jgi:hypothetical protein
MEAAAIVRMTMRDPMVKHHASAGRENRGNLSGKSGRT